MSKNKKKGTKKPPYFLNPKFIPAKINITSNDDVLADFVKRAFPAYITPYKKGVDIVIRKGLPYFSPIGGILKNVKFLERFNSFFATCSERRITVHATITSDVYKPAEIRAILEQPNVPVPMDFKIHIYMSTYEESLTEMSGEKCVDISRAVFGTTGPLPKNVFPAKFKEIDSIHEMEDYIDFAFSMDQFAFGVLMVSKNESYRPGIQSVLDSNVLVYSPLEIVNARIHYINDSVKGILGETRKTVDSIIFEHAALGNLEFETHHLPLSFRSHIAHLSEQVINKHVILEISKIPGKKVSVKRIVKISM